MVRNSKRKAFTIVELVIVIAVIAILAAVMIPTFGGVIDSANLSADKQLLSTVNSQLSIYTGLGNKIETEADLWKALKGDFNGGSDLTAKFDPKSAKNGYHYWYNIAKEQVELLQYKEGTGLANASTGKMMVRAASDAQTLADDSFAAASPRSFIEGFYFLDVVGDNDNPLAALFVGIENMSANGTYAAAVGNLTKVNNNNQTLADLVKDRLNATAVVTDDGVFVKSDRGNTQIAFVYVPGKTEGSSADYYLSSTVQTENGTATLTDADVNVSATVTVPEDIKLGDGCLAIFGDVTVKIDVDEETALGDFVYGASVSADATIVTNTGKTYAVVGAEIKVKEKNENNEWVLGNTVTTVQFRNTVKEFDVVVDNSVKNNIVDIIDEGVTNYYIALDKIKNSASPITLKLKGDDFTPNKDETVYPLYKGVTWSADNADVEIDENGNVTFKSGFNADTITFTATAIASDAESVPATFTVNVVKVTGATVNFASGKEAGATDYTGSLEITDGQSITTNFFIKYNGDGSWATLGALTNIKYGAENFTADEIKTMGCTTPWVLLTNPEGNKGYFGVTGEKGDSLMLAGAVIKNLSGTKDTENVVVTVVDNAGEAFKATLTINVKDNQGTPFESALPNYIHTVTVGETNNEVDILPDYVVGNKNALPLKTFFKLKEGATTDMGGFVVHVIDRDSIDYDNNYGDHLIELETNPTTWDESVLDFDDDFEGMLTIIIKTKDTDNEDGESLYQEEIKVQVVNGTNIGADFGAGYNEFKNVDTSYAGDDLILHSNFTLGADDDKDGTYRVLLGNGQTLYGNYFTVTAKEYVDTRVEANGSNSNMGNGCSLIQMKGSSEVRQLIIDGPVYAKEAQASDQNGLFCFGILVDNNGVSGEQTVKVTDSYIFGFESPIRTQHCTNTTLELTNSVLEGGSWANLFLYDGKKVVLNNSMTIQDSINGYEPTVKADGTAVQDGEDLTNVLGLGIYVHDEFYGVPEKKVFGVVIQKYKAPKTLTVEFSGNTKQINWFGANNSMGGYISTAKDIVFNGNYSEFYHEYKNENYVNAGLAGVILALDAIAPTVNKVGFDYATENTTYAGLYRMDVWSPKHEASDCVCDTIATDLTTTYGAGWYTGWRAQQQFNQQNAQ